MLPSGDPFLVLREEEEVIFEGKSWPNLLNSWLKLVPASGRFKAVDGQVVVLEDMTAREYVESDPLDLDHLSTSAQGVTDSVLVIAGAEIRIRIDLRRYERHAAVRSQGRKSSLTPSQPSPSFG